MEALRQEIRDEMKTLRVNKKHVYGLLMRLCDEIDGGAPAPVKKVVRKTTKKKDEAAEPVLK